MIETQRLLLRPYVTEDWTAVHAYAASPDFSRFEAWGPNSIEDTKRFVGACIASMSQRPIIAYQLAVILREDERLIGGCTLKRTKSEPPEAFLGYAIHADFQRKGYATEAATALVELGFGSLNLSRIYAECNARNVASRRVMEKIGMQMVSLRENYKEIKGVMIDSWEYELRADALRR